MNNKFTVNKDTKCIDYFDMHFYPLPESFNNPKPVPSVTKVIGDVYRKGISFEQWLRDTGNESKIIAKEAAEKGNKIHNALEYMFKGNIANPLDDLGESIQFDEKEWLKLVNAVNWFQSMAKEKRIKTYSVEQVVHGPLTAGKIDWLGWIDGVFSSIDFKTGNILHDENYYQQAGYMKLWNDSAQGETPTIGKSYLMHIGSSHKGQSKGKLHDKGIGMFEIDYAKDIRLFELALEAWYLKNPDYTVPGHSYPLELMFNDSELLIQEKE